MSLTPSELRPGQIVYGEVDLSGVNDDDYIEPGSAIDTALVVLKRDGVLYTAPVSFPKVLDVELTLVSDGHAFYATQEEAVLAAARRSREFAAEEIALAESAEAWAAARRKGK